MAAGGLVLDNLNAVLQLREADQEKKAGEIEILVSVTFRNIKQRSKVK